jgi:hypothetical protein
MVAVVAVVLDLQDKQALILKVVTAAMVYKMPLPWQAAQDYIMPEGAELLIVWDVVVQDLTAQEDLAVAGMLEVQAPQTLVVAVVALLALQTRVKVAAQEL